MKITIFSEELRKCLNAAGLSDCGENDAWNYWYQRLMNAYNESVERQIMTEQAENEKLRELCADMWNCAASLAEDSIYHIEGAMCGCGISCVVNGEDCSIYKLRDRARELGIEVDA